MQPEVSEHEHEHECVILIHYGELGLKGRNQPQFRRQLRKNLRLKLDALDLKWTVREEPGLVMVRPEGGTGRDAIERALAGCKQVFGVAWLTVAEILPHQGFTGGTEAEDFARLEARVKALARQQFQPGRTFAVRVRRGEKRLPFTSPGLERRLGGAILEGETGWKKVDLVNPEVTFQLDVRSRQTFLYTRKIKGPGGLPVGTSGRVLTLLSGGIDSPVAAYLMGRRGCRVDFIHFTAEPFDESAPGRDKICRLAQQLSHYLHETHLHIVPYIHFDLALLRQQVDYELVLFRRFMLRVAEVLAGRLGAEALVTGDNLSQVASQTLSNLVSTTRGIGLPVFRPLLGFDKEEITELARRIGTFEIAIEPYKDCCALISRHPRTSSDHEQLARLEARVFPDYEQLIERTLAEAVRLKAPLAPHEAGQS